MAGNWWFNSSGKESLSEMSNVEQSSFDKSNKVSVGANVPSDHLCISEVEDDNNISRTNDVSEGSSSIRSQRIGLEDNLFSHSKIVNLEDNKQVSQVVNVSMDSNSCVVGESTLTYLRSNASVENKKDKEGEQVLSPFDSVVENMHDVDYFEDSESVNKEAFFDDICLDNLKTLRKKKM
ncbi:hypothetical protein PTKIN_Ptkin08bG0101100 [Pterospermum kingtungense]